MGELSVSPAPADVRTSTRTGLLPSICIAAGVTALHLATNGRYGLHRDELQFLSDARHLDWGFVSYPPFTPWIEHLSLSVFGLSLVGLRLASTLAQAAVIIISGLMARELGGKSMAQATASFAVAFSPLPLFSGTEFQYTSFDFLWWVLIAFLVIRLLKSENPRYWILIGVFVGIGLLTKYSIIFYIAGILAGVVLTSARRYLRSGWFWSGIVIALLIFLPNFLWLLRHDFVSYHFLQSIHKRDVGEGRADDFWFHQVWICINVFATPLALAGLALYLRDRRYRMLAWMYLVPLGMFAFGRGRGYYVAAAYPMLLAMGAVGGERWVSALPRWGRVAAEVLTFAGFAVGAAYITAVIVPLAPSGPLRSFALKNNGDLREEFGWDQLVRTVADIRSSLPPDQQSDLGIVVGNYGEQGAIDILGPAYNLPQSISMTNSAWLRGYPTPEPRTLIVLGFSAEKANKTFSGCRLAGHNGNPLGIKNEESEYHPDIFVCGPPREPWPVFWKNDQRFG